LADKLTSAEDFRGATRRNLLERAVELNVRHSLQVLGEDPGMRAKVRTGALELRGASYRMDSGRVEWM
jgi:carbonic anhydrase